MIIHEPTIILNRELIHFGEHIRIDGFCKLEGGKRLVIGDYVHIASFVHLNTGGGKLFIGEHTGIASHSVIASGQPDFNYKFICPNDIESHPIRRSTYIGEYVMIGVGAIVLSGISIGDYAIIGAGSVVTKSVGIGEVWYGNPAKFIGLRKDMFPNFKFSFEES